MPLSESQFADRLREVALQVHTAEERKEDRAIVAAAHAAVETLAQEYRDLCAALDEAGRLRLERALGRRLTDLRRLASLLPKVGTIKSTSSTPDRQVHGPSLAGERKITGVSWGAGDRGSFGAGQSKLRVGADVEAWCGPCAGLTTHSIIAMVGDDPKQVVCQTCNNRHNFRTTPARRTTSEGDGPAAAREEQGAAPRVDKKAEEQRALASELATADGVRDFNPKERYRVGDVISHPDYGRGKVETVLRSSVLVRFARSGLKSLMLI